MNSVRELFIRPEKGKRQAVMTLAVDENGVVGDCGGSDTRRISMCDADVLSALSGETGLCTRKFVPNIATDGVAYTQLREGQQLTVGGAVLTVTRVGKDCFPACERSSAREDCPLRRSCAFLSAARAGVIRRGDSITG